MRTATFRALLAATAFSTGSLATLGACIDDGSEDAETVAAALELDNGALDTADEAPMFGLAADFERARVEQSTPYTDAIATEPDTVTMLALADARRADVAIVWGQLPPDREQEESHDWTGTLSVNRGAILVRRTIGFEDATDALSPRTERTAVDFTSLTRPFADGLMLTIVDPEPTSADPQVLTYALADGSSHDLVIADLIADRVTIPVDETGNRIEAVALRNLDGCDHGFGRGRWRALNDEVGRMMGEIANGEGEVVGHIRGLWGARADGDQVFFGKYVDVDGAFRGIFAGHYRDGRLAGRWMTRAGEHGRLHGGYRESMPGADVGGAFMLRWAETSCAADFPTDD